MSDYLTGEAMRQWLFENGWDNAHSWTDVKVRRMVEKWAEGGIRGFLGNR